LKAKSAPVTGSASAIALGIAEHLAALGCDIRAQRFGRSERDPGIAITAGGSAWCCRAQRPCRRERHGAIETMMTGSIGESGAIDILITNAATEDANGTR